MHILVQVTAHKSCVLVHPSAYKNAPNLCTANPVCPSTYSSAPWYTFLTKYTFCHPKKKFLGSSLPRIWMSSFWREPSQPAWHLHSSPVAKVMAKTGPWNKGHRKPRDCLWPGTSKRSAWADCIIETTADSPRNTRFQWRFILVV